MPRDVNIRYSCLPHLPLCYVYRKLGPCRIVTFVLASLDRLGRRGLHGAQTEAGKELRLELICALQSEIQKKKKIGMRIV